MLRFDPMIAKRLRPLIATLLLGTLSLVVLPRELFHDCPLEHAHAEVPLDGAVVGADCPVCNLALPVHQVQAAVEVVTVRLLVTLQVAALTPQLERLLCEAPSSRGPPKC